MYQNFKNLIYSFTFIVSLNAFGHAFHDNPFSPLMMNQGIGHLNTFKDYIQSRIIIKNNLIRYYIPISQSDFLNRVDLDSNGNLKLEKEEFQNGYIKIDKWIRKNISLSSLKSGFLNRILEKREDCQIIRADYKPYLPIMGEDFYYADLSFKCSTSENIWINNGLVNIFLDTTKGVLLNFFLVENEKEPVYIRDIAPISKIK